VKVRADPKPAQHLICARYAAAELFAAILLNDEVS
jgi:hypothetical protein